MKVLLLNQCFYPDVVSTAQHLTDLALGLRERGHEVTVVASSRGYDDPTARFESREVWKGVQIVRLPTTGLGKGRRWRRAVDFASFLASCAWRLSMLPRFDAVVVLTSPPLISFLAALFTRLKGGRLVFWVMDLNPDEAVAAGWLRGDSFTARALDRVLLYSLRRSHQIIALDRFAKKRISDKGDFERKTAVIPPWSHDQQVRYDASGRAEFRAQHGLSDKFVVMYSGNHSPCHPLDTLLEAARRLAGNREIAFCFVGGGSEFAKVRSFAKLHHLTNVVCLPYQPLGRLAASLSAADLHVVVMGDRFVGIVHPCKIYNILSIGAPFLYIGPAESHIADISSRVGPDTCLARHGEAERVADAILERARRSGAGGRLETGRNENNRLSCDFSMETLVPRMIRILETAPEEFPMRESAASG
ncbi:MAG TPA: glycosyltransferase family 4 protein [Blastocatellia bacterium]|nr:glycosyltransferase family 4 protein [Blastocatellia bacterium]